MGEVKPWPKQGRVVAVPKQIRRPCDYWRPRESDTLPPRD